MTGLESVSRQTGSGLSQDTRLQLAATSGALGSIKTGTTHTAPHNSSGGTHLLPLPFPTDQGL